MSRCEVCGVEMDANKKTCSRACFSVLMSELNNPDSPGPNDPLPDEISRRASVIRRFNETQKASGTNATIRRSDMYWF